MSGISALDNFGIMAQFKKSQISQENEISKKWYVGKRMGSWSSSNERLAPKTEE